MTEYESLPDKPHNPQFTEPTEATLRSGQLDPYRRESELFRERVRDRIASGEEVVRVPVGFKDSRHAIVDLKQLQRIEADYFALITDPHAHGYIPPRVYCNLKAIHNFLPVPHEQVVQETEQTVAGLISAGVPPFRLVPRYDSIEITVEGQAAYFPIQDYLIYFGAGLLGIQAKERRNGAVREMLPVDITTIRLFAQKAVVNGALDPVIAKHLLRVVGRKFESDTTASMFSERMLREADFLASTFQNLSWMPKVLQGLPTTLRPQEAYRVICGDPYWYLYYSDADRIRVAESYVQLQQHEDLEQFSALRINSFYQAASLILDSLPEPADLIQAKKSLSRMNYEDADPEELRTMSTHTARKNGWTQAIANDVVSRLHALNHSTPPGTLAAIFFGPQGSVLRAIDLSGKLDTLAEVKAAIDQGRVELLKRFDDSVLGDVVEEAFRVGIITKRLKFCGGSEYRELAATKFSKVQ